MIRPVRLAHSSTAARSHTAPADRTTAGAGNVGSSRASWCVTNHYRLDDRISGEVDASHSSAWATFGDGTARFQVDLGSNPEAGSPWLVFVGDEMKHPRDATVIISG